MVKKPRKKSCAQRLGIKNPVLFFVCLLTCSEFGDRSQIAAIVLATNYYVGAIVLGGCVAMILVITMAIVIGKII